MNRLVRKLAADRRGAVIVELALISPVLALLTIGVVDMSNAFSRKLALEQGAQRAIEKIMQTTEDKTVGDTLTDEAVCQVNGTNADGSCKSSPITATNVTIKYTLQCNNAGTITTQETDDYLVADNFPCTSPAVTSKYIQVTVTDKYTPMFSTHFAGIGGDGKYALSAVAGMRIQ